MKILRALIKILLFGVTVTFFSLTVLPFFPLVYIAPTFARKLIVRIVSFYCGIACLICGIRVKREWLYQPEKEETFLIVSNHLSYLDIFFTSATFPGCFVTSVEMKETPILGHVTLLGGCLYVERRTRKFLDLEIEDITKGLEQNLSVIIYPEATSTEGIEVRRFKRPLFKAAVNSKKRVLPLCLNYVSYDGEPVTHKNRHKVCWYGDMTFFPHFWNFLQGKGMEVHMSILPPISSTEAIDFTDLSLKAHQSVSVHYKPILEEPTNVDRHD